MLETIQQSYFVSTPRTIEWMGLHQSARYKSIQEKFPYQIIEQKQMKNETVKKDAFTNVHRLIQQALNPEIMEN